MWGRDFFVVIHTIIMDGVIGVALLKQQFNGIGGNVGYKGGGVVFGVGVA